MHGNCHLCAHPRPLWGMSGCGFCGARVRRTLDARYPSGFRLVQLTQSGRKEVARTLTNHLLDPEELCDVQMVRPEGDSLDGVVLFTAFPLWLYGLLVDDKGHIPIEFWNVELHDLRVRLVRLAGMSAEDRDRLSTVYALSDRNGYMAALTAGGP